jgi:hypothetical protein
VKRTTVVILALSVGWGWAGAGEAKPEGGAAAPAPEFKMNPRLAAVPDRTWVKMSPKFVYHPDQLAELEKAGRKPSGFCHHKGEGSFCYDQSANLTIYFGGCTSGYGNNLWVYDCSGDVWTQVHPDIFKLRDGVWRYREDPKAVPPGCCSYGICYDSDKKVSVLFRSNGGATSWVPPEPPPNNYAWLYAAAAKKWTFTERKGPVPDDGQLYPTGSRLAYDPEKKECLLVGGAAAGHGVLWAYKTAENAWRKVSVQGPSGDPTNGSSWVYLDKEKKFLLFKSLNSDKKLGPRESTTWLYYPREEKWEDVTPKDGPVKRDFAAASYDSLNNVAVMIGGWDERPSVKLNDGTWIFDPAAKAWTQLKPEPGPKAGGNCYQMAYDRVNNVSVYVTGGPEPETWAFRYRAAPRDAAGGAPNGK